MNPPPTGHEKNNLINHWAAPLTLHNTDLINRYNISYKMFGI